MCKRADDKNVQRVDEEVTSDERVMMDVFKSINTECVDPKSSEMSRNVEFDFVSQLDKRRMDDKQIEHRRNYAGKTNDDNPQFRECSRQWIRSSA